MLEPNAIPALSDNYIWVLSQRERDAVIVVDPGEAAPVHDYLATHGGQVAAYLITHHHGDHVGGLAAMLETHPAPVYGPASEADRIGHIDHPVAGGDTVTIDALGATFDVLDVPGHTLGHIAFVTDGVLLAGDALFRGGCGRVFEGSHAQMQASLARLRDLPDDTQVCGGHEYTQKNLAFASRVEPDNTAITEVIAAVDAARREGRPSLPGRIAEERRINPFLRWDDATVRASASAHAGRDLNTPAEIFGALRDWKDAS
ncbi:hydroxyacylglutathione hydrolase [Salinisphaera sp. Q1T1-3]|uniref:hydroxyacylglutathione hydrolase n=1 Tax=Salinisphaera sp. Q1T1-3 TaxID=2321229 RepID=UPI000E76D828|nr:hydroxyacylglutathione hydrolase [Salinisphaera sp. Q1T1-3]RJS93131.1 hydroxyacylglutathione hydrolase [Salinisphaera sp. Q1T1-3]